MSADVNRPEHKRLGFQALRNGVMCAEGHKCHWELSEDTMGFLMEHDEEVQPITGKLYDRTFVVNKDVPFCILRSVDEMGTAWMDIEVFDDSDSQYSQE